jgi:hypothetical protein
MTCQGKVSKIGQSSPFVLMMQASNGKTSNIKVVDLFKTIKMDLNFASFGFLMKKLWALEVGLFCLSMHLVQSDL